MILFAIHTASLVWSKNATRCHRFGFNGMEKTDEWQGAGMEYTTEYRQYDPRLGRWMSLDPMAPKYPWQSPYVGMDNNPVNIIDPSGLEGEGPGDEEPITYLPEAVVTTYRGKMKPLGWDSWTVNQQLTFNRRYNEYSSEGGYLARRFFFDLYNNRNMTDWVITSDEFQTFGRGWNNPAPPDHPLLGIAAVAIGVPLVTAVAAPIIAEMAYIGTQSAIAGALEVNIMLNAVRTSPVAIGLATGGGGGATGVVARTANNNLGVAARTSSSVLNFTSKQLQAKFKHAADFGVIGNYSKANASKFSAAINQHINASSTQVINGAYRNSNNLATFYLNPNTGLTVISTRSGQFIYGAKLSPNQVNSILTKGFLW